MMPRMDHDIASVDRSKAEARHFYDRLSKYYDALSSASEEKFILAGLDLLAIQIGERVLEIGYGTGKALVQLAQSVGEEGHVFGVDLSRGMTHVAQKRLQGQSLHHRVSLTIDDASTLPFQNESMDAIFTSFTLELFQISEMAKVLMECRRVLKQNGRLCVVSLTKDTPLNLAGQVYEWLHGIFPRLLDCRPIPVQAILEEAHFRIVQHKADTMWGLPVSMTLAD